MKKVSLSSGLSVVLAGLTLSLAASAADIRDQMEVQTGKAELVIPDMTPQAVATQVKEAISQWSIPANANFRSLPSTIPARPDEPSAVQKYYGGAPAVLYECKTAYAQITKMPPPVQNAFAFIAEETQACVYPFQKGVKVYLLLTRAKKTESLTAGLFNGITKAIQGSDDERITKQLNENIASIKEKIPSLLIEKIEVPGVAVQEPDKEAVAALIPKKVEAPLQVTAQAVVPATAPTPQQASTQAKIEARKNLTAMGMQYHSQEHFVAAIRRKDDVAVQLYLDAGGLDLSAKENGKSFEMIAEEVGAKEIAKMISDKKTPPPASNIPKQDPSNASVLPPPLTTAEKKEILDKIQASLSPEKQRQVEEVMSQLPVSPEINSDQREIFRAQILSIHTDLEKFTDRIDPETGNLR